MNDKITIKNNETLVFFTNGRFKLIKTNENLDEILKKENEIETIDNEIISLIVKKFNVKDFKNASLVFTFILLALSVVLDLVIINFSIAPIIASLASGSFLLSHIGLAIGQKSLDKKINNFKQIKANEIEKLNQLKKESKETSINITINKKIYDKKELLEKLKLIKYYLSNKQRIEKLYRENKLTEFLEKKYTNVNHIAYLHEIIKDDINISDNNDNTKSYQKIK